MKKHNRLWIAVIAFSLIMGPGVACAGETRIHIQWSIGGAAVIGGGILWWKITHRTRVSQSQQTPPTADKHAVLPHNKTDRTRALSSHHREAGTNRPNPPMPFHIPLFVFRW
ncbi:MAG: hypothetical protein ACE5GK_02740 [Nitrospiria bacterium]